MIDAERIKARMGRLLNGSGKTRAAGEPHRPADDPTIPPLPEIAPVDLLGSSPIPGLDPSPEEIAELLAIRDVERFVERAYHRILGRGPDLRGGSRHARLIRVSPVHSKKRFLAKLLRSEERFRLCRSELESLARRVDEARNDVHRRAQEVEERRIAVNDRLRDNDQHRRLLERQAGLLDQQAKIAEQNANASAEQKALLASHKPIPGLHVRLLEQYRERFEAVDAIVAAKHAELEEQRLVFAVQGEQARVQLDEFARQREDLARQREDLEILRERFERQVTHQTTLSDHQSRYLEQLQLVLEAQRRGAEPNGVLVEQIRIIPQLQADLIAEQRRLSDRQEREGDRRIERVETLVRGLVDAWEVSETLPMPREKGRTDAADPYLAEVELFVHEAYRLILRRTPEPTELTEASERLRSSVGKLKGDFFRTLLEQQATTHGSEAPAAIAAGRPKTETACRICAGELIYKWSRKVLHNRHVAHYHECADCRALQVVEPTWLAEAYADEASPLAENPDQGRFARNFTAYHCIAALGEAGLLADRPMVLDFGGGYGILTQMLRSGGFEAWQADPHVPTPFLASDRGLSNLGDFPNGSFDLVSALEVMEHLEDPQAVVDRLAGLLKPTGTLMLSTTVYHPGEHDQNWFYLSAEWGQHITFWSRPALAECARRAGFKSIGFFPGGEGFFIFFSNLDSAALSSGLGSAMEAMRDGRLLSKITAPWDLQNMGFVTPLEAPYVETLGDSPRRPAALSGRGAA